MRVRIHRGAHEIGGTCIEVEARGARIVLDLGRPLEAPPGADVPLPAVPGLDGTASDLLGVILSHPHQDHHGLMPQLAPSVAVYMGEAACRILAEAAFFTPAGLTVTPKSFLRHREPLQLGPFRITPFLNDHSAFDAYSMLIEADGRALFYTGDLRGHGRKAGLFEQLLRRPPERIDALLMEGTHVHAEGRPDEPGYSERDVEEQCLATFQETRGMVLACFSPQNIDRLVSVYRAALRSGRELVMDLYTAAIARATGSETIPQPGFRGVRVYVPEAQRTKVIAAQAFHRVDKVRRFRIYPDELARRRAELVVVFRHSMAAEFEEAGCLDGAAAIWSLWPGYLRRASGEPMAGFLRRHGIPLVVHHASGHASVADLQRLVDGLAPERVVPIHSAAGDRFPEFFPRVEPHADGEWWHV